MPDIIAAFGRYICNTTSRHPDRNRRLLLAAYLANGIGIRVAPDRQLSPARRFGVNYINDAVVRMLSHPKNAAMVSVFMPCELLQAMGITPMCAEMYSSYINGTKCESFFAETAEAEGISETYCSYHKILLGGAYANVLPAPKMVVNCSLVCDANNLTFREMADYYQIPHFYIDVPPHKNENSVAYVADQFRALADFLQEHTGRPLDKAELGKCIRRSQQTIDLLRECKKLKRTHTQQASIVSELNEIYLTHNALGTEQALHYARRLRQELETAPAAHGIRLLWLNPIPIWQAPVKELLNFSDRCQLTACDMNLEGLVDLDPDKPYESMARRLVYSGFNGGSERIRTSIEYARELDVDGVVCFCHWGCKQTMGLSAAWKTELESAGFPTLLLNGDACDRRNASDGQVATRLNAFVEMLEKSGKSGIGRNG